jgi:hypothetical protein
VTVRHAGFSPVTVDAKTLSPIITARQQTVALPQYEARPAILVFIRPMIGVHRSNFPAKSLVRVFVSVSRMMRGRMSPGGRVVSPHPPYQVTIVMEHVMLGSVTSSAE